MGLYQGRGIDTFDKLKFGWKDPQKMVFLAGLLIMRE